MTMDERLTIMCDDKECNVTITMATLTIKVAALMIMSDVVCNACKTCNNAPGADVIGCKTDENKGDSSDNDCNIDDKSDKPCLSCLLTCSN